MNVAVYIQIFKWCDAVAFWVGGRPHPSLHSIETQGLVCPTDQFDPLVFCALLVF